MRLNRRHVAPSLDGVRLMLFGGGSSCQQCGCSKTACVWAQDAYDIADTNQYLAQSFVTPSGGLTLTKVTLEVDGYDPLIGTLPPGTYSNYPRCRIYNSTTNGSSQHIPDAPLVTLTGPTSIGAASWEFTHAGYSLSASARYWIVLEKNGYWWFTNSSADPALVPACALGGDPACCGEPYAIRTSLGGSWTTSYPYDYSPYLVKVN